MKMNMDKIKLMKINKNKYPKKMIKVKIFKNQIRLMILLKSKKRIAKLKIKIKIN